MRVIINVTLVFQRELYQRPFLLNESSHCMREVGLQRYLESNFQVNFGLEECLLFDIWRGAYYRMAFIQ